MKCQILFSEKNIISLLSVEYARRMVKVKETFPITREGKYCRNLGKSKGFFVDNYKGPVIDFS